MSTLDIRNTHPQDVTEIVFSDTGYGHASRLKKFNGFITLADYEGDDQGDVQSADIPNLVLALQKAKELGW